MINIVFQVPACCDTDAVKAIEDQNERIWLPLTPTIPKDSAESLENRGIRYTESNLELT